MSKKSRKRNKKILAAIGLGLGAVALANRKKKSDLAGTEDNKKGSTRITGGTNSNDYDKGTTKKPDSKMPSNLSKNTGKDNKKVEKTAVKPFRSLSLGIPEGSKPLKLKDNSIRAKNRRTDTFGNKEPNKPMMASIFPKSQTADNYRADMQDFGRTNQYKSGGRVKGCGKALRGFGNAMKKGKR